jgi:hypothetical protein
MIPVWLARTVFGVALLDFFVMLAGIGMLGGDAITGHSGGGHYFLCTKFGCHEVSKAVFTYSWWQIVSVLVVFLLALLTGALSEKKVP